jgi:hypothetical protein
MTEATTTRPPLESLGDWSRTHTCGELTRTDRNLHVVLMGWVHRVRDHGGVLFVDLRDRYGVTQAVVPPALAGPEVVEKARSLGSEWVIALRGVGGRAAGRGGQRGDSHRRDRGARRGAQDPEPRRHAAVPRRRRHRRQRGPAGSSTATSTSGGRASRT